MTCTSKATNEDVYTLRWILPVTRFDPLLLSNLTNSGGYEIVAHPHRQFCCFEGAILFFCLRKRFVTAPSAVKFNILMGPYFVSLTSINLSLLVKHSDILIPFWPKSQYVLVF